MKKIISLMLAFVLILSLCGCSKMGNVGSSNSDLTVSGQELAEIQSVQSSTTSEQSTSSQQTTVGDNNSSVDSQTGDTGSTPSQDNTPKEDPNASKAPAVNLCARVASNTYVIGGVCSKSTEYITVGGIGVQSVKITPTKGKDNSYFISQVSIDFSTTIEIQAKESGKNLSSAVNKFVTTNMGMSNLMTANDYTPVFGLDNRMHYYSAILSYTLSNKVTSDMKQKGKENIKAMVDTAKNVNSNAEVIYLVVPSSAAVYPETVPSEYKAASGESIYRAFESIATQCGAKVIYPLDTMKSHKNDGDGYKIYSHTDSHWTTYGAYWGVNSLMSYISGKYPSAAPRTVKDMGFYTTELYAGDGLFSFGDNNGFEVYSNAASTKGETKVTGIKELTTLYNLKMPTDTLTAITRGKKSVYLTKDNEGKKTETNPNGTGLPTAVIARDSFARTAYDMINDRFSAVNWLDEGDYTSVLSQTVSNAPDYVIYIVSERNLVKVMLNNKDISLTQMQ